MLAFKCFWIIQGNIGNKVARTPTGRAFHVLPHPDLSATFAATTATKYRIFVVFNFYFSLRLAPLHSRFAYACEEGRLSGLAGIPPPNKKYTPPIAMM
jgi:hypothetical protein